MPKDSSIVLYIIGGVLVTTIFFVFSVWAAACMPVVLFFLFVCGLSAYGVRKVVDKFQSFCSREG